MGELRIRAGVVAFVCLLVAAATIGPAGPVLAGPGPETGHQQDRDRSGGDAAADRSNRPVDGADTVVSSRSRGSVLSSLFWWGQVLAVTDADRAGSTVQLRVETDERSNATRWAGNISLDADGDGLIDTGAIDDDRIPGDFVLATDATTFLVVDNGTVVGTTDSPDAAEFELAPQTLVFEFSPAGRQPGDDTTVEITSNRGDYRARITSDTADDASLVAFFGQDAAFEATDASGDGIIVTVPSTNVDRVLGVGPLAAGVDHSMTLTVTDARQAVETAELSIAPSESPGSPPPVVGDATPTDPDGDGRYEDVNGDGSTTPGDATVLFDAVFDGNAAVTEHVAPYDFNDDGRVTPGDATVLFDEVF